MRTGPRDWWRILRDLKAAGMSLAAVGRKVGRDESTVWGWGERGAEPRESDARAVLALYAKHCPVLYAEHQRLYAIAGAAEAEASEAAALARLVLLAQHRARQQAKALPQALDDQQQALFGDQA
jgi:hypothetical protein